MKRRSHKLLMTSLGISVLVHLVGIWGFYKNPLVFSPSHLFSPKHKSVESLASNKEAEKEEKGVALEEALNQMIYDVSLDDAFMNEREHLHESRERREQAADERRERAEAAKKEGSAK